ncbi:hypothetical protein [Micromonospora chersina]|uniref:hypothetical protein n=1 Tax=Micromonospora chersina TaxID=47854 RepID=UPI00371CCE43
MRISTESSQLDRLVAELADVPENAHGNIVKAATFTSNGIKKTARQFASGIAHAPDYPNAITYDVDDLGVGVGVQTEIGPDKDRRQGPLGNILEYGTVNNPPYAHLGPALDRWSTDCVEGLEKAAVDALEAL